MKATYLCCTVVLLVLTNFAGKPTYNDFFLYKGNRNLHCIKEVKSNVHAGSFVVTSVRVKISNNWRGDLMDVYVSGMNSSSTGSPGIPGVTIREIAPGSTWEGYLYFNDNAVHYSDELINISFKTSYSGNLFYWNVGAQSGGPISQGNATFLAGLGALDPGSTTSKLDISFTPAY